MKRSGEKKHRRKGICARLRATGPAAIIDYHHVHLNHITKLLAMTNPLKQSLVRKRPKNQK